MKHRVYFDAPDVCTRLGVVVVTEEVDVDKAVFAVVLVVGLLS